MPLLALASSFSWAACQDEMDDKDDDSDTEPEVPELRFVPADSSRLGFN